MNTELFTGKAKHYASTRPSYPLEAIDYICSLVPPNAVFADIGAGTGLFTDRESIDGILRSDVVTKVYFEKWNKGVDNNANNSG